MRSTSPPLIAIAVGAVRGWMRVYTWGMAEEWVEARRAEIESDVWDSLHDPDLDPDLTPDRDPDWDPASDAHVRTDRDRTRARAAHVVARLVLGIPDDLRWRFERSVIEDSLVVRRAIAMCAAAVLMFLTFFILPAFFWGVPSGRSEAIECANAASTPRTRAEYREQVMTCAGAFFTPRGQRTTATRP